ncbi:flagellar motor switch protein FliN [Buchnera aphidicola]|uniref:flagellar motor switch protein FliN n=1 Tax=Buchnera aphidicola TaxID=9 RepID=UPI003CE5152F
MSNIVENSINKNIIASEKKKSETELINENSSNEDTSNHSEKLSESKNILLNTEVKITIELGKSKIKIKDFLKLSEEKIFILNKSVKEPLDIFINDYLIASGELVVLDKKYGIRITNIKSSLKNINISS